MTQIPTNTPEIDYKALGQSIALKISGEKDKIAAEVAQNTFLADKREIVTFSDLKIRTKRRRLETFVPNDVQIKYLDYLTETYEEFDWRNGKFSMRGFREDVLKARQQGMSTLWLALFFLDTINTPRTESVIITDNGERSTKLFRIIHRFYNNLPAHKKRPKKYSSKMEIEFSDIDSIIAVGTAGGSAVGRGGTINNALLSEKAFWKDNGETELGLNEAIPEGGNVVLESTANGLNDYYDQRQLQHEGESVYHPRFFGWFETAEYATPVEPGFKRTIEEERIADAYGLHDTQLQWRRNKIKSIKATSEQDKMRRFNQEYPINEAIAFQASGHPVFNRDKVAEYIDRIKGWDGPLERLVIPYDFPKLRDAYRDGQFKLWRMPEIGHTYIITADTARGLDPVKGDFDAASVRDRDTWEQVGTLHGRWDMTYYGRMLVELGYMFGTALLVIESNNHGHTVIAGAVEAGYPKQMGYACSGLYYHRPEMLDNKVKVSVTSTMYPGFPTDRKTKQICTDFLANAIEEDTMVWRDVSSLKECMTFVNLGNGEMGGEGNAYDDRVSESQIAAVILRMRFTVGKTSLGSNIRPVEPSSGYGRTRNIGV
jgi:hypothetical protein